MDAETARERVTPDPEASAPESHGEGGVPLRPVLIIAGLILLALIVYGGYSCVRSAGGSAFSDSVSHYPLGSVTYLAKAGAYLVRQPDGSFLALSDAEANATDRTAACLIRYRPDLSAAGETGVFQDDCHGTLFNRLGTAVQGNSPPMQRHPVDVSGATVTVHVRQCVAPNGQTKPCRM